MSTKDALPLIYSCSGCSNIAQLANQVAIDLYREDKAEMSCIAGVGGDVPALVRIAKAGRPIVALDGCPLHCVKGCLEKQGLKSDLHYTLTEYGIRKRPKLQFDPDDLHRIKQMVQTDIEQLQSDEIDNTDNEVKSTP